MSSYEMRNISLSLDGNYPCEFFEEEKEKIKLGKAMDWPYFNFEGFSRLAWIR